MLFILLAYFEALLLHVLFLACFEALHCIIFTACSKFLLRHVILLACSDSLLCCVISSGFRSLLSSFPACSPYFPVATAAVRQRIFVSATVFHFSGIFPALSGHHRRTKKFPVNFPAKPSPEELLHPDLLGPKALGAFRLEMLSCARTVLVLSLELPFPLVWRCVRPSFWHPLPLPIVPLFIFVLALF